MSKQDVQKARSSSRSDKSGVALGRSVLPRLFLRALSSDDAGREAVLVEQSALFGECICDFA